MSLNLLMIQDCEAVQLVMMMQGDCDKVRSQQMGCNAKTGYQVWQQKKGKTDLFKKWEIESC